MDAVRTRALRELERLRHALQGREPARVDDPLAAQAAVALVLAPGREGELEALFIRRAEREGDPWSGHVALPGGRRDASDRDLFVTACRETREETAIEIGGPARLGELDDLSPRSVHLPRIVVRPFVFGLEALPEVKTSEEVASHLWVPLARLRAAAGTAEICARGERRVVPCYRFGDEIVWGITHRILEPFLELGT